MDMQKAEEVRGLRFNGRRIYLEQKGNSTAEVNKDYPFVKRDCVAFAQYIRDKVNGSRGLIWMP